MDDRVGLERDVVEAGASQLRAGLLDALEIARGGARSSGSRSSISRSRTASSNSRSASLRSSLTSHVTNASQPPGSQHAALDLAEDALAIARRAGARTTTHESDRSVGKRVATPRRRSATAAPGRRRAGRLAAARSTARATIPADTSRPTYADPGQRRAAATSSAPCPCRGRGPTACGAPVVSACGRTRAASPRRAGRADRATGGSPRRGPAASARRRARRRGRSPEHEVQDALSASMR